MAETHTSTVSNISKGCFAAIARSFRPTPTPLKLAGRWGVSTVLPRRHQDFEGVGHWTCQSRHYRLHIHTVGIQLNFAFLFNRLCTFLSCYSEQLEVWVSLAKLFLRETSACYFGRPWSFVTKRWQSWRQRCALVRIVQATSSHHFTVAPVFLKLHTVYDSIIYIHYQRKFSWETSQSLKLQSRVA